LKDYSAVVLAVLLGVVSIPIGFGFVAIGKPGGLKYALLFAAIFLLTAALGYRTKSRHGGDIRTVRVDGKPGTEVRYSVFAFWAQVVLIALLAAVFLLAAFDFYLSIPRGDVTAPQSAAIVFGLIGLVLVSFLVLVATGRVTSREADPVPAGYSSTRVGLFVVPAVGELRRGKGRIQRAPVRFGHRVFERAMGTTADRQVLEGRQTASRTHDRGQLPVDGDRPEPPVLAPEVLRREPCRSW
jgi:membrane protease YdiL (CAAX protease family)